MVSDKLRHWIKYVRRKITISGLLATRHREWCEENSERFINKKDDN